jgi:hypothetical protein
MASQIPVNKLDGDARTGDEFADAGARLARLHELKRTASDSREFL